MSEAISDNPCAQEYAGLSDQGPEHCQLMQGGSPRNTHRDPQSGRAGMGPVPQALCRQACLQMGRCAIVSLRLALGKTTSSRQEVRLDQKTLLPISRKTRLGLYASREHKRAALFGQLRSHRPACENQTACPPVSSGVGSLSGGSQTRRQNQECAESILVDPFLKPDVSW